MHLVDTTLFYSPTSGGVKRYLTAKHAWFAANSSWKHSMLVPGEAEHLEPGGISTIPGQPWPGTFNYRLPLNPRRWSRMLEQLEPDLIEAGDAFHPAWCTWRVAQRRNIPAVTFYHSNMPQIIARRIGAATERVLGRYVRWLYDHFDAVLAPSRLMCEYLNSIGVRHTVHQPLGVDADVFRPERRTLDLRAKLGLPDNTRLLAFAGRFSGEKNMGVLLHAFARLGAPYHLLLIGGDKNARPTPNITMVQYRRDSAELAQWLASADALVHAGTKETFGLVILEAMACGRPIVAARAGAVPEIVDDSVGLLARPNDGESMAETIAALYDRDIEAVGAAARSRVLKQFTWAQAFASQLNVYTALVSGSRLPVPAPQALELDSPTP